MVVAPGEVASMRYHYGGNDGPVQAVLPMVCVADDGETLVGWTPPLTEIRYWATESGGDPREVPLPQRFSRPHVSAPRRWQGGGVLRVVPRSENFQIIHFWRDGEFAGWYVNLESVKTDRGHFLDSVDWHLDLWIDPDLTPRWKDEDEARASYDAGQLSAAEFALARATGERFIEAIGSWPTQIGDWRGFTPPDCGPLDLPTDWDRI